MNAPRTPSGPSADLGLEVIVEPDVVPRGTLDVRALDAPAGATPPAVRVAADGSVVRLDERTPVGLFPRQVSVPAAGGGALAAAADGDSSAPTGQHAAVARELAALDGAARLAESRLTAPAVGDAPLVGEGEQDPMAEAGAEEGDTKTLAALDAAVEAPIPPRPAAVGAGALAEAGDDPFESESIGGRFSPAFTLVKVLLYLLTLTAIVTAVGLHLWGIAPWQEPEPVAAVTEGGDDAASIQPRPQASTVPKDDVAAAEPSPSPAASPAEATDEGGGEAAEVPAADEPAEEPGQPSVAVAPGDAPAVDPDEVPAEALDALRVLVADAGTGAEVGVEEDAPGLLARIEGLRADAVSAYRAGRLDEALDALEQLLELSPRDADAVFRVGLVHHTRGERVAAKERYEEASALAPRDPRPLNNLSLIQLDEGDREAAKASLEQALALEPEDPDVLSNLGRLLEEASPQTAHPLYDKALLVDATHGPARVGRARVRRALGDLEGAREDFAVLAESGGPLAARGIDGLGLLARRDGKSDEAVELHREALERDPDYAPARVNLGVALLAAGRDAEALTALERATAALPESARAWQALGVARTRLSGERPQLLYEAKEAYERAIRLDPEDWVSRYDYALCAERFGNFLYAMQQYEKAVELEPTAWPAYANLARLYLRGAKPEKALRFLDQAIQHAPDEADLHFQRAYVLARSKRNVEARASLRRFVELAAEDDPRMGMATEGLGGDRRGG